MESPLTANEESVWVARCKAGDRKAFEPLVRMNATRIRNVVWGLLGSQRENVVDDVVQEVFLKAYLALPKFRGDSKFSTWLYRIAVNHCRDTIRRSPRRWWRWMRLGWPCRPLRVIRKVPRRKRRIRREPGAEPN